MQLDPGVDAELLEEVEGDLLGVVGTRRNDARIRTGRLEAAPQELEPGRYVFVCVADTGEGMDEATLANLFTRFAQGDNSRSRRHAGPG